MVNVLFACFSFHIYSALASPASSGMCAAQSSMPHVPVQEEQLRLTHGDSKAACAPESHEVGSLLQRQFAEITDSHASLADLLYISSMGMDLGAGLSPQPWELVELDSVDLLGSDDILNTSSVQKIFDVITQRMHLTKKFNAMELNIFKSHFTEAVIHETMAQEQKVGAGNVPTAELKYFINKHMILQQPLTTEKMVKDINRRQLGWVASISSAIANLTLNNFESLLGYRKDSDDPIDSEPPPDEEVGLLQKDPPHNFDARDGFPECAEILGVISDQGLCASCWALTTVGVFNDRLCISSAGAFSTQLSAADILACSKLNFGCKGGSPARTVDFLREHGTVTGSNNGGKGLGSTCFPYPIAGIDSTKHFEEQEATPECKNVCRESLYPREYNKDKYFVAGGSYMIGSYLPHKSAVETKKTWDAMRKHLYTKGSIMMMYAADRTHLAYQSGFWDCPAGQPNHMTRCIAYGVDFKNGKYITCMQSWGKSWGEEGRFRMKFPGKGCLEMFQSFQVSWVGKNQETGVPPQPDKSIWRTISDWLRVPWKKKSIKAPSWRIPDIFR
eukprot:gnl/MRDRNA2_/MRDRNA2_94553_c0_seq1.p1 gnl/MRDRNA2_/MRDRNA2_94553_c0~~gnl/MRDRNA2_/MRDRNA2_94553_c0_seq1.p1  ORF type:complete len:560 (+),score=96.12 gnl/MRDRNA2_/MRDRNA2_94553_c0_seq1:111-1790(+)